ncbi:MAG: nucleotidyltransferase domain-containing protein [Nitrososphaerota archaeon]
MQRKSSGSVRIFYPKFSQEEILERIREVVNGLKDELGIEMVVLFGSYAKKIYTVASDVDILVVYDDEKSDNDLVYKRLMKHLKIPRAELHIFSKKEYGNIRGSMWIKTIETEGVKIINASYS